MFSFNPVCQLLKIKYPIVQAGMVWCSGWELASAVSNAGGLGLIGAGSMTPEILRGHIRETRNNTQLPFGVNLPLLRNDIKELIDVIIEEKVKIVFTSAGNPKTWTSILKAGEIKVAHVVSSARFAQKAEEAGVDAIVAEGFEAGGHNGREETTSFVLIPSVREVTKLPLIAAGGMYSGKTLLASIALGADGIQVGSRFAIATESSAHENFKKKVVEINEGQTRLTLKKLTPVRMIMNEFFKRINEAEIRGASIEELSELLGRGRSKKGIFEGDLLDGELEIGQVSGLLTKIQTAQEIISEIIDEYIKVKNLISNTN
jgi:enoyl-[acyl-carrier protein] reductase II